MGETSRKIVKLGGASGGRLCSRAMRWIGLVFGLLAAVYACGGSVQSDPGGPDGGVAGFGAAPESGGTSGFGGGLGGRGGSSGRDAGAGGGPGGAGGTGGYIDPGCPDAAPPPPVYECDPYAELSGCPIGEACYPWVYYPSGPCDFEQTGTTCYQEGWGKQGDPCSGSCSARHICVITGHGTQCAELCKLDGPKSCPPGLLCLPVDVQGFGVCF
jgi:hypothetical protein